MLKNLQPISRVGLTGASTIGISTGVVHSNLGWTADQLQFLFARMRGGAMIKGVLMDRSARDFPMPCFLEQITPFRYTVLDWDQAHEIPAIVYLT